MAKDNVLCVPEDAEASAELGSTMVLSCKMVLLPLSLSRVNGRRRQLLAPLLPPSLSLTLSSGAAALARAGGWPAWWPAWWPWLERSDAAAQRHGRPPSCAGLSHRRLPEGETAGDKNWACPFRPFSGASALLSLYILFLLLFCEVSCVVGAGAGNGGAVVGAGRPDLTCK